MAESKPKDLFLDSEPEPRSSFRHTHISVTNVNSDTT